MEPLAAQVEDLVQVIRATELLEVAVEQVAVARLVITLLAVENILHEVVVV
jgi:hypothetical protein